MKKIVYQIYPVSFKDTTGNGKGDLKGVISKLDYIKSLGVGYIWLCPFFISPFKDNGYDVADYYNVDKKFGSNDDLLELIKEAESRGLKIMLDMVFNHTSIDHIWFKEWINGNPEYKDFYISKKSIGKPPTNWKSKFSGSAWKEYKKDHWYLHLFDESQADLNWENQKVREKIFDVIDYYIDIGVKGFRFDVINLISKGKYIDDMVGDGRKMYTDGPKVHSYIQMLSKRFPKDADFLTVGELSSTSIENTIQYANNDKTELDSVFTFHHLKVDYDGLNKFIDKKPDIKKLNDIFEEWFTKVNNAGSIMATFLSNHDQPRATSRFIDKTFRNVGSKMLFALTSSMPGIPYIYQGEEIGMENADFKTHADFRDVETLNALTGLSTDKIPNGIKQKSRDNSRTPMQWDETNNAGFSTGEPWIKVNDNYKEINVKNQLDNNDSIYSFYKNYIHFIKNDEVQLEGSIVFNEFKDNVISYVREYNGKRQTHIFSFNNSEIKYAHDSSNIVKSNYNNHKTNILQPYEFVVMEE